MASAWGPAVLCGCMLAVAGCQLGGEPPRAERGEPAALAARETSSARLDRSAMRSGGVLTDADLPAVATGVAGTPAAGLDPDVKLPAVPPAIARVLEQPTVFDGTDPGHELAISFGEHTGDRIDTSLGAASVIDAVLPEPGTEPEIPDPTPVPAAPALGLR